MSCYCDFDEYPSVVWRTFPVARKQHICGECLSVIEPGEKYHVYKQVVDNEFQHDKMCMICYEVFQRALKFHKCICFGQLWETVGIDYEIE
jgi:hypothetical protein